MVGFGFGFEPDQNYILVGFVFGFEKNAKKIIKKLQKDAKNEPDWSGLKNLVGFGFKPEPEPDLGFG